MAAMDVTTSDKHEASPDAQTAAPEELVVITAHTKEGAVPKMCVARTVIEPKPATTVSCWGKSMASVAELKNFRPQTHQSPDAVEALNLHGNNICTLEVSVALRLFARSTCRPTSSVRLRCLVPQSSKG